LVPINHAMISLVEMFMIVKLLHDFTMITADLHLTYMSSTSSPCV